MDDLDDLDPAIPEEILSPYPVLWEHWKSKMLVPDPVKGHGSGGVRMHYSPVYLRAVVRHHRWLTEGPGDCPDPALAARCEAVAQTYPGFAERRVACQP